MKRKIQLLTIAILVLFQVAYSQSCPPNIDFESGDFSNWDCFIGKTSVLNSKNVITLTASPPMPGRHEIISSTTTKDQYGGFPQLCPYGGNYSVKLGNSGTGGEAEGISYTFTVPPAIDTFTFTYFYAVVFENPGHAIYEQPRFFVSAYDVATGAVINCASFDYVSTGALPGFQQSTVSSDVLFKDWSPASLQFAGLGGRAVRLEFRTADCTLGGHFGYGYLDVASGCSNILATAPYCVGTNALLLNAPYGFKDYIWYNDDFSKVIGTQQSITLSPPPATSGVFHVDVIPYPGYGCRDTFNAVIKTFPVPDTPIAKSDYTYCQFQTVPALTATQSTGNDLLWYKTATGGTGSTLPLIPSTAASGVFDYYVSQKVLFGCESFRKKITVTIVPTPVTSFLVNTVRQCQNGNNYVFTSKTTNKQNGSYMWDLGDGTIISSAVDSIVNFNYTTSGNFTVKLRVTNDSTCFSEKTNIITVVPKPVATFSYPPIICQSQTTVALLDKSTVLGNVAVINKWWWNINGTVSQTQTPASFVPSSGGAIPVKQFVTTQEGCVSDTNNTVLNVHYRPVAAYNYGTTEPLCNNDIIHFTNTSTIPTSPASESLVKWYWQFNTVTASAQNPAINLAPGIYHGKLISESNFGCKSLEIDSIFTVYPKPNIQLTINDSCVLRYITYQSKDLLGTVANWYWDFGNGLFNGGTLFSKIYYEAGNHPLTVLGKTIQGCKDTIVRPFKIYENIANAGKDTIAAMGEPVQLNAHGDLGEAYVWSPPTGLDNATIETPIATLDYEQLYRLHSVTKEGCDKDSKIVIKRYKGPELYIPTGFTPNRDGLNDKLKVFPVGIRTFHYFSVYNRWGELVFTTTDPANGWDGFYKGKLADAGTFVAVSEAIDYKGNVVFKRQTLALIR